MRILKEIERERTRENVHLAHKFSLLFGFTLFFRKEGRQEGVNI